MADMLITAAWFLPFTFVMTWAFLRIFDWLTPEAPPSENQRPHTPSRAKALKRARHLTNAERSRLHGQHLQQRRSRAQAVRP